MRSSSEVARDTDRVIDAYASRGRNAPDVAGMLTLAVGFPCDIAVCNFDGDLRYQVMTDYEWDFWGWHVEGNRQFFATPATAAAHFMQQYRHWRECVAVKRPRGEAIRKEA